MQLNSALRGFKGGQETVFPSAARSLSHPQLPNFFSNIRHLVPKTVQTPGQRPLAAEKIGSTSHGANQAGSSARKAKQQQLAARLLL